MWIKYFKLINYIYIYIQTVGTQAVCHMNTFSAGIWYTSSMTTGKLYPNPVSNLIGHWQWYSVELSPKSLNLNQNKPNMILCDTTFMKLTDRPTSNTFCGRHSAACLFCKQNKLEVVGVICVHMKTSVKFSIRIS
jgi:hypothetical protein